MFVTINKYDQAFITENFRYNEFFSKSKDFAGDDHVIDMVLVKAVQAIRTYFNVPFNITSSYRTANHQQELFELGQGAQKSYHQEGRAVDLQPATNRAAIMQKIHSDILGKGNLFQHLRAVGITGFGLYDTFLHLDTRQERFNLTDSIGKYQVFDYRKKKA